MLDVLFKKKHLNCQLIVGMEVLRSSRLKLEKKFIQMFHRRVPFCDVISDIQMEVTASAVNEGHASQSYL